MLNTQDCQTSTAQFDIRHDAVQLLGKLLAAAVNQILVFGHHPCIRLWLHHLKRKHLLFIITWRKNTFCLYSCEEKTPSVSHHLKRKQLLFIITWRENTCLSSPEEKTPSVYHHLKRKELLFIITWRENTCLSAPEEKTPVYHQLKRAAPLFVLALLLDFPLIQISQTSFKVQLKFPDSIISETDNLLCMISQPTILDTLNLNYLVVKSQKQTSHLHYVYMWNWHLLGRYTSGLLDFIARFTLETAS